MENIQYIASLIRSISPLPLSQLLPKKDTHLVSLAVILAVLALWKCVPKKRKNINNSLTIITGASSGIGEATARLIAKKGARVIVVARTKAKLDILCQEINSQGGNATAYAVDLTDPVAVKEFVKTVKENFGIPDIVINNAGAGRWLWIDQTTNEESLSMIGAPYLSAMYVTSGFLGEMRKRNSGHIVNVNSPASITAWCGAAAYIASRHALYGFHQALKMETKGTNIQVTHCIFGEVASSYWENNPGSTLNMPKINVIFKPLLQCEDVAASIVQAIERNEEDVISPFTLWIAYKLMWGPFKHIVDWLLWKTGAQR